jgi:hypothetical protein
LEGKEEEEGGGFAWYFVVAYCSYPLFILSLEHIIAVTATTTQSYISFCVLVCNLHTILPPATSCPRSWVTVIIAAHNGDILAIYGVLGLHLHAV